MILLRAVIQMSPNNMNVFIIIFYFTSKFWTSLFQKAVPQHIQGLIVWIFRKFLSLFVVLLRRLTSIAHIQQNVLQTRLHGFMQVLAFNACEDLVKHTPTRWTIFLLDFGLLKPSFEKKLCNCGRVWVGSLQTCGRLALQLEERLQTVAFPQILKLKSKFYEQF